MAIEDFVHGYGTYEQLCDKIGLNVNGIINNIKNLIK
jgi:hypothetical protein